MCKNTHFSYLLLLLCTGRCIIGYFSANKETDLEIKCHKHFSCVCAAVFVVVLLYQTWHLHAEMSATPCLHICSCSDRKNIRPSLLRPYLGSYFIAGNTVDRDHQSLQREKSGILSGCFISMIAMLLSGSVYIMHKAETPVTEFFPLFQMTGVQTIFQGSSLTLGLCHVFSLSFQTICVRSVVFWKANRLENRIPSCYLTLLCPLLGDTQRHHGCENKISIYCTLSYFNKKKIQ